MGKAMGTCFQFGEVRDAFLGRVLAGLDPSTEEIAMLPPYFIEGMEDETTRSPLHLTFGAACNSHSNHVSLSLLLLGSIEHHSDF